MTQPEVSVTPGLREAALEYFTALDKERGAHEARLAVGTDFRGLRESRARAEDALRAALAESPVTPDLPSIEEIAGALYETDPPESWMRTGTDEYRKRAAAMRDYIAKDRRALASPDTEAKG